MKKLSLLFALVLFVLPAAFAAEDFTGKWSGQFSGTAPDGTQMTEPIVLNLVHKGAELTGTAGPSAERQWKILKGKVDGNKLSFEVQAENDSQSGPYVVISLTYADGHLKGDFNASRGEEKMTAKVDVTRAK
jgi:hypothetical protein